MKKNGAIFVKDQHELLALLHISDKKLKATQENEDRILTHLKPKDSDRKKEINKEA